MAGEGVWRKKMEEIREKNIVQRDKAEQNEAGWERNASQAEGSESGRERGASQAEQSEAGWEGSARRAERSEAGWERSAGQAAQNEASRERNAGQAEESEAGRERSAGQAAQNEASREGSAGQAEGSEAGRRRNGTGRKRKAEKREMRDMDFYDDVRVRKKRRRRLTGSMAAKMVAFFLLGIFSFAGIGSVLSCLYMEMAGYYGSSLDDVLVNELHDSRMTSITYEVRDYLAAGNMKAAEEICSGKNFDLDLHYFDENNEEQIVWSTRRGYEKKITESFRCHLAITDTVYLKGYRLKTGTEYWMRIYWNPDFPEKDEFQDMAALVTMGYECRYLLIVVAIGCVFFCAVCFVFLLCSAGHRNGREGITKGILTHIHVDVLTVLFGGAIGSLGVLAYYLWEEIYYHRLAVVMLVAVGTAIIILGTLYCADLAVRAKLGKWWRHSLIFVVLRICWKAVCFVGRGLVYLLRGIPTVFMTLIVFLGICILELLDAMLFTRSEGAAILLWGLEKLALFVGVMYIAMICVKLLKASRALVEGQENMKIDTSRMFGKFKEHGENLNSIGQGISKAVEERMKSEHLKTELITNVSHDIKTPLTSIINYADLICEEAMAARGLQELTGSSAQKPGKTAGLGAEALDVRNPAAEKPDGDVSDPAAGKLGGNGGNLAAGKPDGDVRNPAAGKLGGNVSDPAAEKSGGNSGDPAQESSEQKGDSGQIDRIREYAQVLLRQSRRLKKLLEDLVEASKATTGNLEVNLEPCRVEVLLSQAAGEYQQKMEEKELELIARQPEQPVTIMADGRHLWRVFDNLLNNICKYAQEKSRVYLSVDVKEGNVLIIFRNMSKYPLDISAEELEERFVRGDKSRHMEGNGLGLSIAKSLVELQNGKMEIVIDGDLFKVTLRFRVYEEKGNKKEP